MTAAPFTIEAALFSRLLRRTRRHRMSLGHIQILSCVMASDDGTITTGHAAKLAGISMASTTQLLDGLQAAGHIRRDHGQSDRRHVWITLTDTGRSALTDILSA